MMENNYSPGSLEFEIQNLVYIVNPNFVLNPKFGF